MGKSLFFFLAQICFFIFDWIRLYLVGQDMILLVYLMTNIFAKTHLHHFMYYASTRENKFYFLLRLKIKLESCKIWSSTDLLSCKLYAALHAKILIRIGFVSYINLKIIFKAVDPGLGFICITVVRKKIL